MRNGILLEAYQRLMERFGPQHWWPGETAFEVMVGAILTQNTNWGNVERAIANLKTAKLLVPQKLAACPEGRLAEKIRPCGYFNVKAQRLRSFLGWLMKSTGDGNPNVLKFRRTSLLRQEILAIHGVGPETADSMLLYAFNRRIFVVDAYTRRFLGRHGIISPNCRYDEVRTLFERNLPRSVPLYNEYHALIVRLGKEICRPNPRCEICPIRGLLGPPALE